MRASSTFLITACLSEASGFLYRTGMIYQVMLMVHFITFSK
uniref:Uncharacterized protein n=1 Tax=Anguilla anguilla TaxID=7936 RepID=A0A0E9VYU3_ANGAN